MIDEVFSAELLCRSFAASQALAGVTLSVSRGTVCALLGPNGAGKTTLFKLLAGMLHPTSGSCVIRTPHESAVGCLIDGFEPPGRTRIRHLIELSREAGPKFDLKMAEALLADRGLTPNAVWKTLSKGQKRWVQLVMLLCRGCDVLLLDEPADGLDPATRRLLYQTIRREANERSVTALIATHIVNDIERVTDDVCILHRGRVILHESLEDLREQLLAVDFADAVELPDSVQVLHTETGEVTTCWIRDITGTLNSTTLPGELCRRHVGLEDIYLAVTSEADAVTDRLKDAVPLSQSLGQEPAVRGETSDQSPAGLKDEFGSHASFLPEGRKP